jgi:membrane protease YdiL (CAAX protease family)
MESITPDSASPDSDTEATENGSPLTENRLVPYWHTALLLLVLGVFSVLNAKSDHNLNSGHARVRIYLVTMFYEWLLTGYVWWGLRRAGLSLRNLIGGRWRDVKDVFLDAVIALGTWFGALLVIAVAALSMHMGHSGSIADARRQIGFLAPQSGLEVVLWICLSATAGFCEEVLFRGYLQNQFSRLLGNRWIALVVVSILFGLGHGYEGAQRMLLIALLGFAFGIVSIMRKSLRPAIMAHTLQDTISGLLLRALR